MKKLLLLILLFSLYSCGETENSSENNTEWKNATVEKRLDAWKKSWSWSKWSNKNEFNIEIKSTADFNQDVLLEKSWKIIWNQSIDVKSQISWRLSKINVKEWDSVLKGQILWSVSDSYSKYYLDLEKARIDYDKQLINKESQTISLEKKVSDTEIALNDAKVLFENAKKSSEEDRLNAELNYKNSDIVDVNSQSYLEVEKAKLDYENLLKSNNEQTKSYIEKVKKEYNNIILILWDVIKFSDELLGVTYENKDKNDDFEDYLWANDSAWKITANNKLLELISYENQIKEININSINEENIFEKMNEFYEWYENINSVLFTIEWVLNNSIPSVWSLSESEIDSFISKVNGFQSSNQNNLSSFTSTKSSIETFLNTYKDKELLSQKNLELLEKKYEDSTQTGLSSYNKAIINIENTLHSYELKVTQAESNYDNALKNKDVTIKSLNNSILSAKNNLSKTQKEYSKLTITSPINGTVSSINLDENTEVTNWSNIFSIVSNHKPQVEILLSEKELKNIKIWDTVDVIYWNNTLKWFVYSQSNVANKNLEFKTIIELKDSINLIGWVTTIQFKQSNSTLKLPVDLIEIQSDNIWSLNILLDWKLSTVNVELWKIENNNIQILSKLDENIQIIVTDMKNYNSTTDTLKVNTQNEWNT